MGLAEDSVTSVDLEGYTWGLLLFRRCLDHTLQVSKGMDFHEGAMCTSCGTSPLFGIRWRCVNCVDFDLCNSCYASGYQHDTTHVFARIPNKLPLVPVGKAVPQKPLLPNLYHVKTVKSSAEEVVDAAPNPADVEVKKNKASEEIVPVPPEKQPPVGIMGIPSNAGGKEASGWVKVNGKWQLVSAASPSSTLANSTSACCRCHRSLPDSPTFTERFKCFNCQDYCVCKQCINVMKPEDHFRHHIFAHIKRKLPVSNTISTPVALLDILPIGLYPSGQVQAEESKKIEEGSDSLRASRTE